MRLFLLAFFISVHLGSPECTPAQESILLSEVCCDNRRLLADEDGDHPDWIELFNPQDRAIDLKGLWLSDDIDVPLRWPLPRMSLGAQETLLVFCSGKDRRDSTGPLHTDFRLRCGDEPLILSSSESRAPVDALLPRVPWHATDTSFARLDRVRRIPLVDRDTEVSVLVPVEPDTNDTWQDPAFDDRDWIRGLSGVGYSRDGTVDAFLRTDLESEMFGSRTSARLRIAFKVDKPEPLGRLVLSVRSDDGFVAWLNGRRVASWNAPEAATLSWDSAATAVSVPDELIEMRTWDLSSRLGLLRPGRNVLAIQGLNAFAESAGFLVDARLDADQSTGAASDSWAHDTTPSPARRNGIDALPIASETTFSHASGLYRESLLLEARSTTNGAIVRYTLDGSIPTETSASAAAGIRVDSTTRVTARAIAPGRAPGPVATVDIVFVDDTLEAFQSELSVLVIDTQASPIAQGEFADAIIAALPAGSSIGDTVGGVDAPPGYLGRAGIRVRGSSSLAFPKPQYALELRDARGDDADYPLLGMPPESDWVLHAPYIDKTLLRNELAYRWSGAIGMRHVRTRFVELFVNSDGDDVGADDYFGVYLLVEKIKRGPKRLDLDRLTNSDIEPPMVTGGYIFKRDPLGPGEGGFQTSAGSRFTWVEPDERQVTAEQSRWLTEYIERFERTLHGRDFESDGVRYDTLIDRSSFVDQFLFFELTKNIDSFRRSTYFYKPRGGPIRAGPMWDFDLAFGTVGIDAGSTAQGWLHERLDDREQDLWLRMLSDPEFRQESIDRWQDLRERVLSTPRLLEEIDRLERRLGPAAERNFEIWRVLGAAIGPEDFVSQTWEEEIRYLATWLETRLAWIDSNWLARPSLVGPITLPEQGAEVLVTAAEGDVWYTLDGSDPRLPGGDPAPTAFRIESPRAHVVLADGRAGSVRTRASATEAPPVDWYTHEFDDATWPLSSEGLGVGFERGAGFGSSIDVDVGDELYRRGSTVFARYEFDVDGADIEMLQDVILRLRYDDGFRAWLNGELVAVRNAPSGEGWNDAATQHHPDDLALELETVFREPHCGRVRRGRNILAIQGLNASIRSSDLLIEPELTLTLTSRPERISIDAATTVRARAHDPERGWSGLRAETFRPRSPLPLRVSELHFHPPDPTSERPGSPHDREFVEVINVGPDPIHLAGVRFSRGIEFAFPSDRRLQPGEVAIVVGAREPFESVAESVAGVFRGRLQNSGESIELLDAAGFLIQRFRYGGDWWRDASGGGHSCEVVDPWGPADDWSEPRAWRPSSDRFGSPGRATDANSLEGGWRRPGDANGDGWLDVSDPVLLLRQLFSRSDLTLLCGDDASPIAVDLFDWGGNGRIDLSDAVQLLQFLFRGGEGPSGRARCLRTPTCPGACPPALGSL